MTVASQDTLSREAGDDAGVLSGLLPAIAAALHAALREQGGPAAALEREPPVTLGLPDSGKGAAIAALADLPVPALVVVTARPGHARVLEEDIAAWWPGDLTRRMLPFPVREAVPYDARGLQPDAVAARLRVVSALARGEHALLITDVQALSQRTALPDRRLPLLERGGRRRMEPFLRSLAEAGYQMAAVVDAPGTAARRGGIVDVFAPGDALPLRIEWDGNRIESIREFDPMTQRSQRTLERVQVQAATEATAADAARTLAAALRRGVRRMPEAVADDDARAVFSRALEQMERGALPDAPDFWTAFLTPATLWDHLPAGALLIWDEPDDCRQRLDELDELSARARADGEERGELPPGLPPPHLSRAEVLASLRNHRPRLDLRRFGAQQGTGGGALRLGFQPVPSYGARLKQLVDDLQRHVQEGSRVVVVSQQALRLAELLHDYGVPAVQVEALHRRPSAGVVTVVHGSVDDGWRLPVAAGDGHASAASSVLLFSDTEIFGFAKQRRKTSRPQAHGETFLEDLQSGDLVVHIEHGIARFQRVTREQVGEREREYLELRFASNDRLLVPTDQLHRVQRYVGGSGTKPALTRLGTQQWQRAKQRVRVAVQALAEELLSLYATRQVAPGIAAAADTTWQMELEASFPYVETADQVRAIRDVKADMERARPMDRIVVGDVGYGKTEVAIRAAFKAAIGGRQVALLVPTTVLAQQHLTTFRERLAAFPVRVEMLSRFRTHAEQRQILAEVSEGAVDIVIGTHRLLQRDVQFKQLGLVIIDEEQRFGVMHKETLKQMRQEVDVLTLSATPIPRTMHMALSGIRDMSTIATPPEERLPVTTYVMASDDSVVRTAILAELDRGGQIYFVHNRVQSIHAAERWLRTLVPEARFVIGHGQMWEHELERVMTEFVAGDADVLICTTIIESGLDIPNVNTIMIHDAQQLGLAQLYQLRGRVGRGAVRAYAYLLYNRDRPLPESAQKRLQTIFDATELGAGFQIALRDLEIRGTGNLLGAEQSGPIGAVGFTLYTELLAEAVEHLKALEEGRPPAPPRQGPTVAVDLPLVAHIPPSYIEEVNVRLSVYKQFAAVEDLDAGDALRDELRDRFGAPPEPVETLLRVVRLRTLAARLGAKLVTEDEEGVVVRLAAGITFDERAHRTALPPGVTVGRSMLRLDPRRVRGDWLDTLEGALEALGESAAAAPV